MYILAMFILGLSFTCPAGIHMFTLFNDSAPSWNLLLLAFIEVVVVGWIYGAERVLHDLEDMGMKINPVLKIYWTVCWKCITPLSLLALVIFSWVNFGHVSYEENVYPTKIQVLGYFITGCTLIWIPIFAVIEIDKNCKATTRTNEVCPLLQPTAEWGRGPTLPYGCIDGFTEANSVERGKYTDTKEEKIPLEESSSKQ